MAVTSTWLRCGVFLLLVLTDVYSDLFTSTRALHDLMSQGQGHLWAVQRLVQRGSRDSQILPLLSQVHTLYREQPECIEHPVTVLRILKIFCAISQYADQAFHRDLARNDITWPTDDDITGTYHALARLQKTYDLSVDDVINGTIAGVQSAFALHDDDVIGIAEEAVKMGYNASAALWLSRDWSDQSHALSSAELLCRLSNPISTCSRETHNKQPIGDAVCASCNVDTRTLQDKLTRYPEYENLCKESQSIRSYQRSNLLCSYRSGDNPLIRYKQEFHSLDPVIVRFYDVITDLELKLTTHIASQILENSVMSVQGKRHDVSGFNYRVGQVGWVYDNWHPVIAGLSTRIGDITGLSTRILTERTHAEPLQVCNYGIGGHFRPHQDAFATNVSNIPEIAIGSGNRDATFMLYLTDVVAGGATVFPELGVFVKPVKNSAILWYNTKRSGARDERMVHAGCPVLIGNKWIANKWLWSIGQTFRRRCGRTPDDDDVEWALQTNDV